MTVFMSPSQEIKHVQISLNSLRNVNLQNACTLVPTVFLRHLKTKFEFQFSFSVFLRF